MVNLEKIKKKETAKMDKLQYHLEKIQKDFPSKTKFNKTEMLICIKRGEKWFKTRVEQNRLDKVPKFKVEQYKRGGNPYFAYEFDIIDIADFLAK